MLQDLIFVLASLADNLCHSLASENPLEGPHLLLPLAVPLNLVESSVQELMGVFLDVRVDRLSLSVLYREAKGSWLIVLFLTPLQVGVHLLQLIEKIIDNFNSVNFRLSEIWLQRH